MKRRMIFKSSIVLSLAFWLAASVSIAWAHAYPTVSVPADGATVREAPREVRIQFTEGVEIEFSQIAVKGPGGEKVSRGNPRRIAEDTIAVDMQPLRPGTYTIEWQVLSVDTHVTEGVLRFTVDAGGK